MHSSLHIAQLYRLQIVNRMGYSPFAVTGDPRGSRQRGPRQRDACSLEDVVGAPLCFGAQNPTCDSCVAFNSCIALILDGKDVAGSCTRFSEGGRRLARGQPSAAAAVDIRYHGNTVALACILDCLMPTCWDVSWLGHTGWTLRERERGLQRGPEIVATGRCQTLAD